ncbi:MAG: mercuric reductase [Candidatus Binatia bacterium]|nr:mercuric reductase [Candidatus Binatia bacterium]
MSELPVIEPLDEYNRVLIDNVHPADWENPEPTGRYNLVVVGAGSAGLIAASIAAGLGAKVALIERHYLGGDCLNVGCVPSKGIIRAARMVADARRAADEIGLPLAADAQADFGLAMERVRRVRSVISTEDSARRYRDELGVEVYLGDAQFTGRDTVAVGEQTLQFKRAIIATGARAVELPIPGLGEAGCLTNETLFNLTERPRRFGVIGAGPIGCEMAQAFRRLGSEVVVLHADGHILPREDVDAAEVVQQKFADEGIRLVHGCKIQKVEVRPEGKVVEVWLPGGGTQEVVVDEILLGVGRAPNVEGLGLEEAGVEFDVRDGVKVDDTLQTTNPRIFSAGDVCMSWKFTHAADATAKIVVQNALFSVGSVGRKKLSDLVMPWCTYTDPEIAHVGMYEHDAKAAGLEVDTWQVPLHMVNRAVTDGEAEGFVKVHTKKGTDEIVGATIVATHAGEMISEVTLAMVGKLGLGRFVDVIHPYPVQAEGIKRAAGLFTRGRLTPTVKTVFNAFLGWQRL